MNNGYRRFILFVYSTRNIVGCALALVGLGLYFAGIIGFLWPVIIVGLYAVGYVLTPRQQTVNLQLEQTLNAAEIRTQLERLNKAIHGRVSKPVLDTVKSIEGSILSALPQLERQAISTQQRFTIQQTALEYLPQALEAYLNLPPTYARMHPVRQGKTAEQILLEQLKLLDDTMQEIVIDLHKNDAQKLLVHGRFLEEKFRKDKLAL